VTATLALFYLFGAMALGGALAMVLARNPVYGAIFLITTLIAVAGEFLLMGSPLLAVLQILVYAGAIMVLYLFVIMLLNLGASPDWRWWKSWRTYVGFGVVAVIAGVTLASVGSDAPVAAADAFTSADVKSVARLLFSDPTMIFLMQTLGVLLLIAVVTAIYIGRHLTDKEKADLEAHESDSGMGSVPRVDTERTAT